jgi:hypothetical protein
MTAEQRLARFAKFKKENPTTKKGKKARPSQGTSGEGPTQE